MTWKQIPWVGGLATLAVTWLLIRLIQTTTAANDVSGQLADATAKLAKADSIAFTAQQQDIADSLQRERDQFIMDSLGGVIRFQTRTIAQWERAKATLYPVDTSLAVEVQLARCQDNEMTLRVNADVLASSLALATEAGTAAITQATASKLRADSADARRVIASDSVRVLLAGATKALHRPWYKKVWAGTTRVVTATGLVGVGVMVGKLL